jgi:hypothetical protein
VSSVDAPAAREAIGERLAVRDHEQDGLLLLMQCEQQLGHATGRVGVEVARRLVAEDDLRLPDERPGNRHTLLLSARERRGAMIEPGPQANLIEQRMCAFGCRRIASPTSVGTRTFSSTVHCGSRQ